MGSNIGMHLKNLIKYLPFDTKMNQSRNMKAHIDGQFHNFDLNSLKEMELLGAPEDGSTSELLHRLGTIIT